MDETQQPPLTERQGYWLKQLESCEASGKTIAEYALAQGIEAKAMYAGKKVLVKKGVLPRTRPSRFQRVQRQDTGTGNAWHIELANGVSVGFSGTVDARTLSTVLTAAAAVS